LAIQIGERMPPGSFGVMTETGSREISTDELFSGKKVVLVSVPGAFTPTCSIHHVPGYVDQAEAVRAKGVDTIACMAVNDVFVMGAWAKDLGVGEDVAMLADGNGDYTRALGLELDGTGFGLGMRGKRFAIIVDNGIAIHVAVEAPGKFEVSDVESILERL
jgi:peroxiredoxin